MRKISILMVWLSLNCFNIIHASSLEDQAIIKKIEHYLNGIQFLVSNFIQNNPDQTQFQGTLYLTRKAFHKNKGKMAIIYQGGVKQKLIAKDGELTIYDLKDGTKSSYDMTSTPFAFILEPKIDLHTNITVERMCKEGAFLEVTLSPKADATGQSMTLCFNLYPNGNLKYLERWVIKDIQGNYTSVNLILSTMRINDSKVVPENIFFHP